MKEKFMTVHLTNFNGLSLEENVKNNFKQAGMHAELACVLQTRFIAVTLAKKFGADSDQAAAAALLHNISCLIPLEEYLDMAHTFDLDILPEEKQNPDFLGQKLSRVIAVETFDITDKQVLNAIACHNTLKAGATTLDKIVFLSGKLAQTQKPVPAFIPLVIKQLDKSLDDAVYCYLFNNIENAKSPQIIHPWSQAALNELTKQSIAC